MAKAALGSRGMESAVRALPHGESVVLWARGYDKLVKDLEYVLTHLSEENLTPELRARLEKRDV